MEYVFPRFFVNHLYGLFQNEYKEKTRGVGNGIPFFKVARKVRPKHNNMETKASGDIQAARSLDGASPSIEQAGLEDKHAVRNENEDDPANTQVPEVKQGKGHAR